MSGTCNGRGGGALFGYTCGSGSVLDPYVPVNQCPKCATDAVSGTCPAVANGYSCANIAAGLCPTCSIQGYCLDPSLGQNNSPNHCNFGYSCPTSGTGGNTLCCVPGNICTSPTTSGFTCPDATGYNGGSSITSGAVPTLPLDCTNGLCASSNPLYTCAPGVTNTDYFYNPTGNVNTGVGYVASKQAYGCGCGYQVGIGDNDDGYDSPSGICLLGYTSVDTDEQTGGDNMDIDCCCSDLAGVCGSGCQPGYSCPLGADPRQCCSMIVPWNHRMLPTDDITGPTGSYDV